MVDVSLVQISFNEKKFGKKDTINIPVIGMSVDIKAGEFLTIVSPVNNGKTRLLRVIAGLTEPDSGTVLYNGKLLSEFSPSYDKMAMVFQSQALYPHLNVRQNLEFGLKMANLSREAINPRITEIADLLGISNIMNRKPKQLSGSQKQLVAIARAFVKRPQLIIFDEPLSELDSQLKVKIQSIIRRYCINLHATVIYATRNPSEAMTLGDRIVCIHNGRIQQIGTSHELYNEPKNEIVARFIGYPEMNFLEYEMKEENNNRILNLINAGCSIQVPQVFEKIIESYPKAKIGIRAENLKIVPEGMNTIPMIVEMQEYAGSQSILYVSHEQQALAVEVPLRESYELGETVHIELVENGIHLFANGKFVI
ncbi:MAG: ABC transporter ATP-binding protein [Fibromonadaceae bacterium]|jgi:ABC-type sugar transport system ATPase subunit|nr:ABC transporter ATP-binding protein [Fibromonadaceae bacterium]